MNNIFYLFICGGGICGICYIANVVSKYKVAKLISNNENLSNKKAKYITDMMSKDINVKSLHP